MRNLQFLAGLAGVGTFVAFTIIYLLAFCFSKSKFKLRRFQMSDERVLVNH